MIKKSLKDNYDIIDKVIYNNESYKELKESLILQRAKKLIDEILNNKVNRNDYGFNEIEIDCINNTDINGAKYYIVEYKN